MKIRIDDQVRQMAEEVIQRGKNKRAIVALEILLEKGQVSTDDLKNLGYNHPPRAIGDVRDLGIPIITGSGVSEETGRTMAVYMFGSSADIRAGRIGGRSAFPKRFKKSLIAHYGSFDSLTRARLDESVLQIDHRVPFRVSGEINPIHRRVEDFMLLDASSQRQKSHACENCENFKDRQEVKICRTCYWAFPTNYKHIAMKEVRRTDLFWNENEVAIVDQLEVRAKSKGISINDLLKPSRRGRYRASPLTDPSVRV